MLSTLFCRLHLPSANLSIALIAHRMLVAVELKDHLYHIVGKRASSLSNLMLFATHVALVRHGDGQGPVLHMVQGSEGYGRREEGIHGHLTIMEANQDHWLAFPWPDADVTDII